MPNVVIPPPEQAAARSARTYDHPVIGIYVQTAAAVVFATLWLVGSVDVRDASGGARFVIAAFAGVVVVASVAAHLARARRLRSPAPAATDAVVRNPGETVVRGPGLVIALTAIVWASSGTEPSTSPGIALGWLVGLAITAVFGILQIVQVQAAQRRDGRLLLKDGDFFRA